MFFQHQQQSQDPDPAGFYAALDVPVDADADTLKRSYRKMALKYHPDKNKAPEAVDKFKTVSRAYEVLSDDGRRKAYDEGGEEGLEHQEQGGGGGMRVDPSAMFAQFFGGGDPFFGGGGGGGAQAQARQRQRSATVVDHAITLKQLVRGSTVVVEYTEDTPIDTEVSTCTECNGLGIRTQIRPLGIGMVQQVQMACAACRGAGYRAKNSDTLRTDREIDVEIPYGHDVRSPLVVPAEGKYVYDELEGRLVRGELHVRLHIEDDSDDETDGPQKVSNDEDRWELHSSGRHLVWSPSLPVVYGLATDRLRCVHLDGKIYILTMTADRSAPMVVPRLGMPETLSGEPAGALIVKIRWDWSRTQLQQQSWFVRVQERLQKRAPWTTELEGKCQACMTLKAFSEQEQEEEEARSNQHQHAHAAQCRQS